MSEAGMSEQTDAAEVNICERHHFVWTWPIEGGAGAVGVCDLCGAVTTAERDAAVEARGAERALRVLDAAHDAADELDEWDGYASPALGGCSPGGVVRHAVHRAHGVSIDECPSCARAAARGVEGGA